MASPRSPRDRAWILGADFFRSKTQPQFLGLGLDSPAGGSAEIQALESSSPRISRLLGLEQGASFLGLGQKSNFLGLEQGSNFLGLERNSDLLGLDPNLNFLGLGLGS